MAIFVVGDRFASLADLEKKIQHYQNDSRVQFTLRDSRTLENARKRAPKRVAGSNLKLRYYSLHYTCVCGGKKYRTKGQGIRPHQRTIKQECKAGIKLSLSGDKQSLMVTEVNEEHNHPVYQVATTAHNTEDEGKSHVKAEPCSLPIVSSSFNVEFCHANYPDVEVLQTQRGQCDIDADMRPANSTCSVRDEDEDELFLLSLLPSLKRLNQKKRLEVRMEFLKILYAAEYPN